MTTIGIRELKSKTSEVLREVSQKGKEFIVTRHGRPCGKLVPIEENYPKSSKKEKKILRASHPYLPELSDKDFQEAKKIWSKTRR